MHRCAQERDCPAPVSGVSLRSQMWRRWLGWMVPFALLLCVPTTALAWGERGHQMINAAAIRSLPEPLRSYFLARQALLVEHAIDPDRLVRDDPQERPHHYTEVDAYDVYPFTAFRRQFVEARRGPSPLQLQHGDSVWQIDRFTLKLIEALRRRRWDEADRAALFAAHYAADLTQPLHTVVNYDGQLTGQQGIHMRFETELVNALADRWILQPQPAMVIVDLRARIFEELATSYSYRNVIYAADRIAVAGRSYVDPQYGLTFRDLAGLLARKRLEAAACFVASLWYTAWVRAGKPVLRAPAGVADPKPAATVEPWRLHCLAGQTARDFPREEGR